ncbi:MAG: hypothetical protein SGILL_001828 [Bacillariaceae sp.]
MDPQDRSSREADAAPTINAEAYWQPLFDTQRRKTDPMDTASSSLAERLLQFVDVRNLEGSSSANVYETCSQQHPDGNTTVLLQCVSDTLEASNNHSNADEYYISGDMANFLLVISGALIFFMQTGFAMLCAGCVQLKNVQNTMLKNLLDACGSAIAFFLIGELEEWIFLNRVDESAVFLTMASLFSLGYSLAFGGQDTEGRTFVGKGDYFATGPMPSYWFFGT